MIFEKISKKLGQIPYQCGDIMIFFDELAVSDFKSPIDRLPRFIAAIVAVMACVVGCSELRRPNDHQVAANYFANEACFQQMAESVLSVKASVVFQTR